MSFSRLTIFLFLPLLAFLSISSVSFAQDNQIKIYTTRDGLAGDYVTAIAFARDGSAWLGTTEGATHIETNRWTSYTRTHGLGDSWITSIAIAPDERVWFGTQSGGLAVLDLSAKTFKAYNLDNSEIPSNFVTAVAVNQNNLVWVGTLDQGIASYDVTSDKWTRYPQPGKAITAISLASNGQPWVGTPSGVWSLFNNGWQSRRVGDGRVQRMDTFDGKWYLTTDEARYVLLGDTWVKETRADAYSAALQTLDLSDAQIIAFGKDAQQRVWLGTARGLQIIHSGNAPTSPKPLPVVLIHGWTVAGNDTLATSEFRFLASYADRDGIPMYYVRGVSPKNTLYQNAQVIRDEIARVKKEAGAEKVNIIGFSMGGMNTRAYLETSLYANDVNRAIILGTPQAGVEVWKPILFQQILQKPDEPSTIELSPEYAQQVVNATRSPNPNVPYDLLVGDASQQMNLDFFQDMPKSDALISDASALALDAPNVRKHVNADLHDWSPQAVPLDFTAYLYPRDTWERYLRNALRNNENAPISSEIATTSPAPKLEAPQSNHTPVITEKIRAGETVTRTMLIDENKSARFISYYPGGKIDFSIIAPDGKKYEPSDLPRDDNSGVLSLSTDIANFSGYNVKNAAIGKWQLILKRADSGKDAIDVSTYVELDSPRRLVASENEKANGMMNAFITAAASNVKISARVATPSSQHNAPYTFAPLQVNAPDENGTFSANLPYDTPGWYVVFVTVRGDDFERETEFLYMVPTRDIGFQSGLPLTIEQDASAPNQLVPSSIGVDVKRAGSYTLAAHIRDANDNIVARSFTPVTLNAGQQRISFSLLVPDPDTWYTLDLGLYDTNWAALKGIAIEANVKFKQPK